LEVRGDGAGPAVPLDLHPGGAGRHGRHYPPGADPLRRPSSYRQEVQRVRDDDGRQVPAPVTGDPLISHARGRGRLDYAALPRVRVAEGPPPASLDNLSFEGYSNFHSTSTELPDPRWRTPGRRRGSATLTPLDVARRLLVIGDLLPAPLRPAYRG
jgi:hypothetical protein